MEEIKRIHVNISIYKIFKFLIIFIFLTIIGTQTHEWGHYLVAKSFNFNPILHYDKVSYTFEKENAKYNQIKVLLITIAGPLETITVGFFGFFFLIKRRKNRQLKRFNFLDWLAVFLSLFWLRQVFNFSSSLIRSVITGELRFGGDEAKISKMLNTYSGTFGIITGAIGIIISYYVIFKFLKNTDRYNLLIGGFLGSIIGYIVWFQILGKIILP